MLPALSVVVLIHSALEAFKLPRPVEKTYIIVVGRFVVIIASYVVASVRVVGHVISSVSSSGTIDI